MCRHDNDRYTGQHHKRHKPPRIDLIGFCGGILHEGIGKTLDREESGIGLSSVAIQQVKIDVGAWDAI